MTTVRGIEEAPHRWAARAALLTALGVGLYLASRASYLLFHSLAEIFSVTVAFSVFAIGWSSRHRLESAYLLFVSVAYLPIGLLDLLHTLTYEGMPFFADGTFRANQLWIAARALEAATLLAAFTALSVRRRPDPSWLLAGYGGVTALLAASIFKWRVFPVCFVAGVGQTPFKIVAEYAIIAALAGGLLLLRVNRDRFEPRVRRAIAASMLSAIASEFCFTLYASNFGAANLVGHLFKIASYAAIYLALVETAIVRPHALHFRELNAANARLTEEIEAHERTEREKDDAIRRLHAAMDEIQTLRGIIPICAHCKKIRDDQGAWSQVEAYIQRHSEARFSHGICPDCLRRYYPDDRLDDPDTTP